MRSSGGDICFDFISGSNMDPTQDVHILTGKFRRNGENAVGSEWVTCKDGRPHETTKFSLKRLKN